MAGCLLLVLPWVLYAPALDLWWTEDDFLQLQYTLEHSPREYGARPEVWQRLPNRVLSPLLFASYDLDLALFGLEPRAFYAHQLMSVGLAALAFFLALRLWMPTGWSLLGSVVFVLGPPVASFPPLLMVRHYPEAIALGLFSAGAFGLALRRRGRAAAAFAVLSALLYAAASAAKEIAVPLPGLLAVLPLGNARRRLLLLVPHAGVAALYVGYRVWMLGTPLGGYGWAVLPGEWPALLAGLPRAIGRELAGHSAWGWTALAALAAIGWVFALRTRRRAAFLAAAVVLAVLPILPASVEMNARKSSASWLVVVAAFAPAAWALAGRREDEGEVEPGREMTPAPSGRHAFRRRVVGAAAIGFTLVAAIASNREAWADHLALAQRRSAENRGLLTLGRGEFLRHPAGSPASLVQLGGFARRVLDRPVRGDWFFDDLFLCLPRGPRHPRRAIRKLWAFDPGTAGLMEITSELPELRARHCSAIRRRMPLEARFRIWGHDVLGWTLGPYEEGSYSFVLQDGRTRYEVPREGGFQVGQRRSFDLRVRYDSPEGWITYSPPLSVELASGKPYEWHRGRIGGHPAEGGNQP